MTLDRLHPPARRTPAKVMRAFQRTAADKIIAALHNNPILCSPGGSGKTFTASTIVKELSRKTLWLAHRKELIEQAAASLRSHGLHCGIIKSGIKPDPSAPVQVASIQTLGNREMPDAELIVIDECRRAAADTYQSAINYYPNVPRIGLDATPFRTDGRGLGNLFGEIIVAAYFDELVEMGYLISPQVYSTAIPDLRGIKISQGEYNLETVVDRLCSPAEIIEQWKCLADGTKTVGFSPNVSDSINMMSEFRKAGVPAEHLDGTTPDDERSEILARLASGETLVVWNAAILCLDIETEILTRRGFVGPYEITPDDLVANWDEGKVFFEKPTEIVRRERMPSERMVSLKTRHRSIRVTEGHRLIHRRSDRYKEWKKSAARDLVDIRINIPVSGLSEPEKCKDINGTPASKERIAHLITKTAYNIRKSLNISNNDSRKEATRRVLRKYSLRLKNPSELSDDECILIGFWLGDGGTCKLKSGGIEYTLNQPTRNSHIIETISGCLSACKIDYLKKQIGKSMEWHIGRGTGGGVQERNGFFAIEPYLDKSLSELIKYLPDSQLASFLKGWWLADGNHLSGKSDPSSKILYSSRRDVFDKFQAILVTRGYCASIRGPLKNGLKRNGEQCFIYRLSVTKRIGFSVTEGSLKFEPDFKKEIVWCVKTRSKNIITRRHGSVTVMGNTEGWDLPALGCAIMRRPTASLSLHLQMDYRIVRSAPGKTHSIILDFAGNHHRHGLPTRRLNYSLNPGDHVGENDPLGLRQCQECLILYESKLPTCPHCGYTPPLKERISLDGGDGQLTVVVEDFDYRQRIWLTIEAERIGNGYKPYWSIVRYEERFGEKPVVVTRGEFRELVDPKNATREDKGAIYEELKAVADERGFSHGWISHRYREFFGVWPVGFKDVRDEVARKWERMRKV